MKRVIHLIPRDGLGGVEQAARSLIPTSKVNIEIVFLSHSSLSNASHIKNFPNVKSLNSLSFFINGFKYLLSRKPNILVSSLWRSTIISIPYVLLQRLLKRDFKFIIFIHNNKFAHLIDKSITTFAIKIADEVWCDSKASKDSIIDIVNQDNKVKVISFFINSDITSSKMIDKTMRENNFVFWGRISKQKGLDEAIHLFKKINENLTDSHFYIYGPDGGELNNLRKLVTKLKLEDKVLFMGPKKPNEYPAKVRRAKFFFNTSIHEGMAIAVTEAMQLGLVPIVTGIGEISNYCTDGVNSIYIGADIVDKVMSVVSNDTQYQYLSLNAIEYWNNTISYSEDFNLNILRVIDINK